MASDSRNEEPTPAPDLKLGQVHKRSPRLLLRVEKLRPEGPPIRSAWVETDQPDGSTSAIRIDFQDGYAVVGPAAIFPKQPDRVPASADLLGRSHGERTRRGGEEGHGTVPIGGFTTESFRAARTEKALEVARDQFQDYKSDGWRIAEYFPELGTPRRVGERPHRRNDQKVAEIAAFYVGRVKAGDRAPVQAAAEQYGYSLSGIRKKLDAARERGILTRPPRGQRGMPGGKAGGELTDKGKRLTGTSSGFPSLAR